MDAKKHEIVRRPVCRPAPRIGLCAALLVLLAACVSGDKPGDFEASVNPTLEPELASIPDAAGTAQPIAASRDEQGIQSEFVEGVILVRPRSDSELRDFVARYDGTVIADDAIPAPPPGLGVTLTDEERKPTAFAVRVRLAGVDAADLAADARAAGLDGAIEFSSEAGLRTFAQVLDARAAGFEAMPNYISKPQQAFPQAMFTSQGRPGALANAFAEPRYAATGNQTNVALAWQFLLAHGIQRRVQIAIIDSGFWLNTLGQAAGADSDFTPAPAQPIQYDFLQDDYIADGPNPTPCSANNPCFWHGTGAAGVAAGTANNNLGYAGTGSFIATPMLFKRGATSLQDYRALRTAVAWGADVASMSFGGDCDRACRIFDRDHNAFGEAVGSGSRIVFVASAGNGRGIPAAGYDVGAPSFVHPCIEDHVICVGALNEAPALTPQGYSNFGARVTIFAPTNLPVMSYPPSVGPTGPLPMSQASGAEGPRTFGGTSASAPFVSGVAAMMKAINPDLNSDDVGRILMETARPGVGQASRVVDALAAVRRAAAGIPMVNDRFENNSLETNPTNLGAAPPYVQRNLNINGGDRDYFTFTAPGGSTATIDLSYVDALGPVSVLELESQGAHCAAPVLVADAPLPPGDPAAPGRRLTYAVPGGPHRLALKGTDINAYNLGIAFTARAFTPDPYEVNDQVAQARHLNSWKVLQGIVGIMRDPRVTIDANIHAPTDVDYYTVRGARIMLAEQVVLAGYSAVAIYGNESPIRLQVFRLNPDDSAGPLVADVGGGDCAAEPLEVRLDADAYYLLRVSGSTGNYTLSNSVFGDRRRFPILVRDQIYEVLHPGEPIEHVMRHPELYVFAADPVYDAVRTPDPRAHMKLLDREGNVLAEGATDDMGERLTLSDTVANGIYGIEVAPQGSGLQAPALALQWEQRPPVRVSDNLVRNPGAEAPPGDAGSDVAGWRPQDDVPPAHVLAYGAPEGAPSSSDPGPPDRGTNLFAGSRDQRVSGLRQEIAIDPAWRDAIARNSASVLLSAYQGGHLRDGDFATATFTFLGDDQQTLGQVVLPSIGPREREGKTGLWPAEVRESVPAGTTTLVLDLAFVGVTGRGNGGYLDNLSVTLLEQ